MCTFKTGQSLPFILFDNQVVLTIEKLGMELWRNVEACRPSHLICLLLKVNTSNSQVEEIGL